jgi:hypothetical protein
MPRGSKPGERRGGRQKGTLNKTTKTILDKFEELNCDPLEGMIRIAERAMEEGDLQMAGSMYKELAQYVAPKRKAVELSNEQGSGPLRIEWKS